MWATDLSKMNDPEEMLDGRRIIMDLFGKTFPSSKYPINGSFPDDDNLYLVSSASKNGDVLSQWRSYAQDGTGFSIGIDEKDLNMLNLNPFKSGIPIQGDEYSGVPEYLIEDVLYSHDDFTLKIEQFMQNHLRDYGVPFDTNYDGPLKTSSIFFMRELAMNFCLLKSDFYKEEQEVRIYKSISIEWSLLAANPLPNKFIKFDFLDSPYGIKPYAPIYLWSDNRTAIKEIVIGPRNPSSIKDVETFLKLNGYPKIEISKSAGNYR